ncbi:hypothetical protein [Citrobacter phage IME-JL8]|uniref:Uncharacterized protein n=1 Tax=Citrobacter phage IME-JL8 TaxID=2709754 RepID=A0A6G6XT96_9CAUD|nr:hypothetical protein [Citrobacter phage IME-JL8]
MATYRVNFKSNARTDERKAETVTIPDCVPFAARNHAICATLNVMGYDFAVDPIIVTKAVTIHAVECGIPNEVKVAENIDILA